MTRKQFGKELVVFEEIQHKFSKMAVAIYAMEAMAYMTAGIIDSYQKPDASLEAAIVKVVLVSLHIEFFYIIFVHENAPCR